MAQPRSRLPLYAGLTVAGVTGYYLYTAGGSPKVAEKQFESDIHKASAKTKAQLPGTASQVKKDGEKWASEAGQKVDSMVDQAKAEAAKAEGKFEQYRKDASKETMRAIDNADRKVEESAAKAKSGISSWFGGK
ncbi:hypothetical protein GLAREA_00489 [Glarea lozoyensis ATCC 20868]|uniref:Calcofluor white hypersensitive protein n=2 Tax=Glarea lozoyensis TaxID=101852 RepID=S3CWM1_GLAL2|nr:uncharacterized protein GLAREA_00489 [Glarea lozoyensis ATCC 20868]EHL03284.1 hypothetical protein M7I_0499 [Glarea lozoyensis 74030]EPE29329.1 hypothetical protein GLAREA_00489 [Glarea lozoyensis ATCC 20868]